MEPERWFWSDDVVVADLGWYARTKASGWGVEAIASLRMRPGW